MIRTICQNLEFPNVSWNHLDTRDRDNNLRNKMKVVERVSFPVQKTPELIFIYLCSLQRHIIDCRLVQFQYIQNSDLFLYAAGCCCWGWAALGLWTSGTVEASGVWCCSQTGPSWRCQTGAQRGRGSNLRKTDETTKHKRQFLPREYVGK